MINLLDSLGPVRGSSILVVGDIFLDHFTYLSQGRLHRDPQGLAHQRNVYEKSREEYGLGGAALAAKCVRLFDGEAFLIGRIGSDLHGGTVDDYLAEEGVRFSPVFDGRATIAKHYFFAPEQRAGKMVNKEIFRYDDEDESARTDINLTTEEVVEKLVAENIKNIQCILIWDFDKGLITERLVKKLVVLSQDTGVPLVVKPKTKWYKYRPLIEPLVSTKSCLVVASWDDAVDGLGMQNCYLKDIKDWKTREQELVQNLVKSYACDYFLISVARGGMIVVSRDQDDPGEVPYDVFEFSRAASSEISIGHRELLGVIMAMSLGIPIKDFWKTAYAACCVATMQLKYEPPQVISWKSLPSEIQNWNTDYSGEWPEEIGVNPKTMILPLVGEIKNTLEKMEIGDYEWIKTIIPGYISTNNEFKAALSDFFRTTKHCIEQTERKEKGAICLHIYGKTTVGKGYLVKKLAEFFGFNGVIKVDCPNRVIYGTNSESLKFQNGVQVLDLGLEQNKVILIDEIDKLGPAKSSLSTQNFHSKWLCLRQPKYSKNLVVLNTSFENAESMLLDDLSHRIRGRIEIPSLMLRKSDIPYLITNIIGENIRITKKAIEILMRATYPEEFTDLENIASNLFQKKEKIIHFEEVVKALHSCGLVVPKRTIHSDNEVLEIRVTK